MLRLLPAAACLLFALPCLAQDLSPRLDHAPLARLTRGEAARLRAIVTSPVGRPIVEVVAYVRPAGLTRFSRAPLAADPAVKDLFVAALPDSLASGDFDYYLEAFDADGNGPARAGSPEAPFHVAVSAPAIAAPAAAPPTPAQHVQTILLAPAPVQEPRSHSTTTTLGILGGLVTGCGTALALESQSRKASFAAAQLNGWTVDTGDRKDDKTFAVASTVLLSVGGALLVGALISGLVPSGEPEPAPAVAPPPASPSPVAPAAAPAKEASAP